MVGAYTGDASVGKAAAQGLAVALRLDCGIALDASAQTGIVLVGVQKVRHACLAGDVAAKERQLPFRGDVRYVQACPACLCHFCRQGGTLPACLGIAYFGMVGYVRVIAVLLPGLCHVGVYACRVLTMGHDEFRSLGKEFLQHLALVHKHVARAASHEEFHGRVLCGGHGQDFIKVVVGGAYEEAVVHVHALLGQSHALAPTLHGGCLRNHVGHVQH